MVFAWGDISYYFGPAFLPFTLPALIIVYLGWRLGSGVARRDLRVGRFIELAAAITCVPLISWAQSLLLAEQMAEDSLGDPIVAMTVAVGWGLALFAAVLSWAVNLDNLGLSRRSRKAD